MRRFMFRAIPSFLTLLIALLVFSALGRLPAVAATQNYATTIPGVVPFTFFLDGQFTATQTAIIRFNMPFAARVLNAQASCQAITGTSPQNAIDIKDDGTTILTDTLDLTTADTVVEGSLVASPVIADESVMTVDFTITGTTPTFDDCTLILVVVRE